jgi:hypothetical protein
MENFRDLEKEYKQKKLTKVAFRNHNEIEGKYKYDSNDSSDYNYYSDDSDSEERKSNEDNQS